MTVVLKFVMWRQPIGYALRVPDRRFIRSKGKHSQVEEANCQVFLHCHTFSLSRAEADLGKHYKR
jgi:hypothetical protein